MRTRKSRLWLRGIAALALAAWTTSAAQAQSWPTRPVKVVMATAAGSAPDVIARIVTDKLAQIWGQQTLILNRPGGGGLVALQALSTMERDHHTLYLPSASSLVVLPETTPRLPLDLQRDLVPVGFIGEQPFLVVAGPQLGVSSLPELIALAKRRPGELTYAGNFRGSLPNMTGELLRMRAGIELTFVPYAGAPQGLQDVMGGRVSLMVEGLPAFMGALSSNAVKPLAVTSLRRLPNHPDLATVAETIPGFESTGWFALLAPAGTPTEVVSKINTDLRAVLDSAEVRARFEALATYVRNLSPAETGELIRAQQDTWRPVVKQIGTTDR